jgi:hypothetical protein
MPQFLISSVSITTSSYRIAQIFFFVLVFSISTRRFFSAHSHTKQILLSLTILQIPVIAFGATQIEQSVYFAVFAGIVLYKLSIEKVESENEILFALVAILITCRTPALILIPIILIHSFRKSGFQFRNLIISPLAAAIPVFFVSFAEVVFSFTRRGLNSDESAYSDEQNKSFALWKSIDTEFDRLSLALLALSIVYLFFLKNSRLISVSYIFFCSTVYSMQIPDSVVGHNKYAFEVFTPLIVFAILKIYDYVSNSAVKIQLITFLFFLCIFILSSVSNSHLRDLEETLDGWKQTEGLINYPVSIDVEKVLLSRDLNEKCVNLGATYGNFNYVLSGLNVSKFNELNLNQLPDIESLDWGRGLKPTLNLLPYKCLVLDGYPLKSDMRRMLQDGGYEVTFQEISAFYGTRTEIWEKEPTVK